MVLRNPDRMTARRKEVLALDRVSMIAVAPFHGPCSNHGINEQATVPLSMHRLPHYGPGSPKK